MKRKFLLIISIIAIFGGAVVGCGREKIKEKKQMTKEEAKLSRQNEILKHLEEKYGEKFIPLNMNSEYIKGLDILQVYKEGTNPVTDKVEACREEKDGKVEFYDGYFGMIIRPEYEKMIKDEVDKIFPESKVYLEYGDDNFNEILNKDSTYEDAIKLGERLDIIVRIYIEDEKIKDDLEEKSEELNKLLKLKKLKSCSYTICNMKKGILQTITREKDNEIGLGSNSFEKISYGYIRGYIEGDE